MSKIKHYVSFYYEIIGHFLFKKKTDNKNVIWSTYIVVFLLSCKFGYCLLTGILRLHERNINFQFEIICFRKRLRSNLVWSWDILKEVIRWRFTSIKGAVSTRNTLNLERCTHQDCLFHYQSTQTLCEESIIPQWHREDIKPILFKPTVTDTMLEKYAEDENNDEPTLQQTN